MRLFLQSEQTKGLSIERLATSQRMFSSRKRPLHSCRLWHIFFFYKPVGVGERSALKWGAQYILFKGDLTSLLPFILQKEKNFKIQRSKWNRFNLVSSKMVTLHRIHFKINVYNFCLHHIFGKTLQTGARKII